MDNITASEIAGFGFGAFLVCATFAAPRVDSFISSSQRLSLGMCKTCGDLNKIACKNCRGAGLTRDNSLFGFHLPAPDPANLKFTPCTYCQGRGHFTCPDCPKSSSQS